MRLADETVSFTLGNLALFALAGAVGGLLVGLLMKKTGLRVFGDLFFGIAGSLIAVYFFGSLLNLGQYGFTVLLLVALAGGIVLELLARFILLVRRRVRAAS